MFLSLRDDLEPLKPYPQKKECFLNLLTDREIDYQKRMVRQSLFASTDWVVGDRFYHGYLEYLEECWSYHRGIVLTPDILWQTLLGEIAAVVLENPASYRSLFSREEGKQEILVPGRPDNPDWIGRVMESLRGLVPVDTGRFLPQFSTSTPLSQLAQNTLFCQMVSPYYSYSVFACGIPAVEVRGERADWYRLIQHWADLKGYFPEHEDYFDRTGRLLAEITTRTDRAFWAGMFTMERCGSGSERVASGWWLDLYREQPRLAKTCNFPNGLGRVDFRDLTEQKEYQLITGLLSSREIVVDGVHYAEPLHGFVILERKEKISFPLYGQ